MPNDLLKEAHTPLFEDDTSYRDPLKELEEWANKQRVSLEIMVSNGYWDRATYEQNKNYLHCYERVLAKIAEMRENKWYAD